jgi:hypothetical protein
MSQGLDYPRSEGITVPIIGGFREVLRSVRRALEGVFGGRPAADEIKPTKVEMGVREVDVDGDLIRVEVAYQSNPSDDPAPEDVRMGRASAFETVEDDAGREYVAIADRAGVVAPSGVMDFENPHEHDGLMDFRNPHAHGKLMDSHIEDVGPGPWGEVTLGLGIFPDGPDERIPAANWATAEVSLPPRETDD